MRAPAPFFRFLLRLQGAIVVGATVDEVHDQVLIQVRQHGNAKPHCPTCDRVMGGEVRWTECRWRHFDLFSVKCFLVAQIREARCPRHGRRLESVPWARGRARHTAVFDQRVASLVQVADKTAAARMFGVAWRTVGRMVERVVKAFLPGDLLEGLEAIAVDETSYKRGHRYLTVVTDLMTGRVVWVGEGKSAETLGGFFELLGQRRRASISVVCMDMGEAFRNAVQEWLPDADIVYDRFHVVKLLLEAIDEVRRQACRETGGVAKHPLKNTRFALLRNPKHLRPQDQAAIALVQQTNRRLARAYELRVSFEDLWTLDDEDDARSFLARWTRSALLSRLPPLRKFATTVRTHLEGILGFFRYWRQTSGPIEGMNNKIKLAIHRAYGFHSITALVAMIHLCCSGIRLPV
ncbi:MAG: ISL3 family transposase [bacterium]